MKNFTMVFGYYNDDFEITLETNYMYEATNEGEALSIASKLQGKECFSFQPFFAQKANKVMVRNSDNPYYDEVFVTEFKFYDETKGDYIQLDLGDGKFLYPCVNPICYVELDEIQFCEEITKYYKEKLLNNETLTFSSLSWGVKEVMHN
ncbi:hypothetical protein AB1L05_16755 [Cytobacillus horneckiae]|uniref:hypothetical protein n=1 Tax=Cytobacillus horneckiae TaxID=549687 RepID=UPI0039A1E2EF